MKNGIAKAIIYIFIFIYFVSLENMWMSPYDNIRSSINTRFGYFAFSWRRNTDMFISLMEIRYYEIALLLQ